ncbi:glycoside hydrolase family 95 protein [Deinococcus sp. KSM4-11]|uniref:glycoside hydrolase family 95 protein n=1 Tax=Deinococcus sp. KSM4-11 TaxID=2568654 RepID=UPI0010A40743|nr:glycoside hydrolase family 95 protein [Deinococcus sp. KSM4-11]THF87376.1 glycoside hydrolase family 95 protein [Deinococcus sp. KSM4-11]
MTHRSTLWYPRPAADWNEALPVGNGWLGAMVHGGLHGDPHGEHLDLNEGTLWSGQPRDDVNYEARRYLPLARALLKEERWYDAQQVVETHLEGRLGEAYQPLGTLRVQRVGGGEPQVEYRRTLDLGSAIHAVQLGAERRETFISAPDHVLVGRWTGLDPAVRYVVSLGSPHPHRVHGRSGDLHLHIHLPTRVLDAFPWLPPHPEPVLYEPGLGLEGHGLLRVRVTDGQVGFLPADDGHAARFQIEGASGFTLLFTAASSFAGWNVAPRSGDPEPLERCIRVLDDASALSDDTLTDRHRQDHAALFDRVTLDLNRERRDDVPTDERLRQYAQGTPDADLERLYFDFGRYLLIACSRPGGQPATLQGLWNPHVQPPWQSDYTININTQMNYWPAEPCGLGELSGPLETMLHELAASGQRTARVNYGARGWAAHHNTDLWRMSTPTGGDASWAMWPLGGAWLARQLWERQLFRPDPEVLARHWPVLEGAARFLLDWLVEEGEGTLGTSPSTSPENRFLDAEGRPCAVSESSTMDLSIIQDLLQIAAQAAETLDTASELRQEISLALPRLRPLQVGERGELLEWSRPFPESEPGHRHVSHLYGLYPAHLWGERPNLQAAARRTLELRLAAGGGHTGWSAAWLLNLHARLHDGAAAAAMLRQLLSKSTLPNLFDNHPPFQIDGNFGGTAGIAELLLQSQGGDLRLLPALPPHWTQGAVRGLRARGGLSVDVAWADGHLTEVILRRVAGDPARPVTVHYLDRQIPVKVDSAAPVTLGPTLTPPSAPSGDPSLETP